MKKDDVKETSLFPTLFFAFPLQLYLNFESGSSKQKGGNIQIICVMMKMHDDYDQGEFGLVF